jgi:hypothetical protein
VRRHSSGTATDAIDRAESSTAGPPHGLRLRARRLAGRLPQRVGLLRVQEPRGQRRRGRETARQRRARRLRCCRTLVLVRRPALLREAES